MDPKQLRALLAGLQAGDVTLEHAVSRLETLPFADLGFARVDHHRSLRQGIPEVIYGAGKTVEQIAALTRELAQRGQPVLVTRLQPEAAQAIRSEHPELDYNPVARTARLAGSVPAHRARARVAVVTAGTSDLSVAEEATETLAACGIEADTLNDVGVAGLHRLLPEVERLASAHCVIVVAGMEGALASVVGGLIAPPVVAVPTSVGYGAALGGTAALLGMLTTCASGVTVVNIDNGFGAAIAAVRMTDRMLRST